jgi:hypothetical protein
VTIGCRHPADPTLQAGFFLEPTVRSIRYARTGPGLLGDNKRGGYAP